MAAATAEVNPTVKTGQYYSRLSYGQVVGVTRDQVTIINEEGRSWTISREIFDAEFTLADQFNEVVFVNRTQLIEHIRNNPRTAITVNFRKKLDEPSFANNALDLAGQFGRDEITSAAFKKKLRAALQGEERTILGRHENSFDEHGRLRFVDVESRTVKLIDPRTVQYAIIRGVKYEVK